MTVRTLRMMLEAAERDGQGDRFVVMAKDREGNGFSPLSETSDGRYRADTDWSGELVGDGGVPALVLWPVN